jgi:hypothetical protein
MLILARLKAAKWKLLGGVVVSIVLCGVALRFLSLPAPPASRDAFLPPASVNSAETKSHRLPTKSAPTVADVQVYKNPKTGRFENPPLGANTGREPAPQPGASGALANAPTDSQLTEWMSAVAGGGIVTNVRLRFRRPLVATKEADGALTIQHAPEATDAETVQ